MDLIRQLPKRFHEENLQIEYEELFEVIKQECFFKGDFTLASGQKSNHYFDLRPLMCDYFYLDIVTRLLGDIFEKQISAVRGFAGLELGSVPYMAAMSKHFGYSYVIVRKAKKDHGMTDNEIIMPLRQEHHSPFPCVIVDDVISTGASIKKVANAVGPRNVRAALCIINRSDLGDNMFLDPDPSYDPQFQIWIDIYALYYARWFFEL